LAISTEDRRALAGVACYLAPGSVLEIGTHIGSSTLAWAAAAKPGGGRITTVDIHDVNDPIERPWQRYNARQAPIEIVRGLAPVEFVVSDSVAYLASTSTTYDLIFLDGDHRASTVYRELPLALARLNRDGVIVLHDYYPNGRPLLHRQHPVVGPYLAVRRLASEGLPIRVLPLGELPWLTSQGSPVISTLALVLSANGN
jgi:predicted O-methyltransferase YrrM